MCFLYFQLFCLFYFIFFLTISHCAFHCHTILFTKLLESWLNKVEWLSFISSSSTHPSRKFSPFWKKHKRIYRLQQLHISFREYTISLRQPSFSWSSFSPGIKNLNISFFVPFLTVVCLEFDISVRGGSKSNRFFTNQRESIFCVIISTFWYLSYVKYRRINRSKEELERTVEV